MKSASDIRRAEMENRDVVAFENGRGEQHAKQCQQITARMCRHGHAVNNRRGFWRCVHYRLGSTSMPKKRFTSGGDWIIKIESHKTSETADYSRAASSASARCVWSKSTCSSVFGRSRQPPDFGIHRFKLYARVAQRHIPPPRLARGDGPRGLAAPSRCS